MESMIFINQILIQAIGMDTYLRQYTESKPSFFEKHGDDLIDAIFYIAAAVITVTVIVQGIRKKKGGTETLRKVGNEKGKYNIDTIDNYDDTLKKRVLENNEVQANLKIKEYDPDFNANKFKENVTGVFIKLQEYLMDGNLDELRDIETDELYEQHKAIIENFQSKHQKNIRENVDVEGCYINSFFTNKNKENIVVDYVVKMKDYIYSENKKQLKAQDKNIKSFFYRITFVRTLGTKTNEEFEPGIMTKCPNCGADIQVSVSEYCPYCNSLVTTNSYGWVISNIDNTLIK